MFRLSVLAALLACGLGRAVAPPPETRIDTGPGQRLRVALPGGAAYVNEGSSLSYRGARLNLRKGEVYIDTRDAVTVIAGGKRITAADARFLVRGDSVRVASGKVGVDGREVAATPGLAAAIRWAIPLHPPTLAAPPSRERGGALVVTTGESLPLLKYHLDVHAEGDLVRTTVDWTFFNNTDGRHDGTFRFPLPRGASICRLAMYVNGKLMEGGMAERNHARRTFEAIVNTRRDPALLEWVDGSTFSIRIFPIEPREEKRLFLSYTQRLVFRDGEAEFRFPAPDDGERAGRWSFAGRLDAGTPWACDSHKLSASEAKGAVHLRAENFSEAFSRDLVLRLRDTAATRFASSKGEYLRVRHRPDLGGLAGPQRRDWVVLMETAADRTPAVVAAQCEAVRSALSPAGPDDTFQLFTASRRTLPLTQGATPLSRLEEALAKVKETPLLGALDVENAFRAVRPALAAVKRPHLLHVGGGSPVLGERSADALSKLLPEGTRYVGAGLGRGVDEALMRRLAAVTGGYSTRLRADEPVNRRGLEIAAALESRRLTDVRAGDGWHVETGLVESGQEIAAVFRGKTLPERVTFTGTLDGKPWREELAVRDVRGEADALPRVWAKEEIDRLLVLGDKGRARAVELSKRHMVMTPHTSLIVLETDEMYKEWNIDRAGKAEWAWYPAPKVIPYKPAPPAPAEDTPLVVRRTSRAARGNWAAARGDDGREGVDGLMANFTAEGPEIDATMDDDLFFSTLAGRQQFALPWRRGNPIDDEKTDPGRILGGLGGLAGGLAGGLNLGGGLAGGLGGVAPNQKDAGLDEPGERPELVIIRMSAAPPARLDEVTYRTPSWRDSKAIDALAVPGLEQQGTTFADGPRGKIDPAAKALLDKARRAGPRALDTVTSEGLPCRVTFDGQGRYVRVNSLSTGFRERVLCDGELTHHVYSDLEIATRRKVDAGSRLALFDELPLIVPPAEDLAGGADVSLAGPRAVLVVSHRKAGGKAPMRLTLRFGANGDLVERVLDHGETVTRQTIRDGTISVFEGGRLMKRTAYKLTPAEMPSLKADLSGLQVVEITSAGQRLLPSPRRTFGLETMRAYLGEKPVFTAAEAEQTPLTRFLWAAYQDGTTATKERFEAVARPKLEGSENVFESLIRGEYLRGLWSDRDYFARPAVWPLELPPALAYAKRNAGTPRGWDVLNLVRERLDERPADKADWLRLAELFDAYSTSAPFAVAARYEKARSLLRAGKRAAAKGLFLDLDRAAIAAGRVLPVDRDFRRALGEDFAAHVEGLADGFTERGDWWGVALLAARVRALDALPLADALARRVVSRLPVDTTSRRRTAESFANWLLETRQPARADALAKRIAAASPDAADVAPLTRTTAALGDGKRRLAALEAAFRADRHDGGPWRGSRVWVNVGDELLVLRVEQHAAYDALDVPPPPAWRESFRRLAITRVAHAPADALPAEAIQLLRKWGEVELARDLETSRLPGSRIPFQWSQLTTSLAASGDDLAERVYRASKTAFPTSGVIRMARARELAAQGRTEAANAIYREMIAEEKSFDDSSWAHEAREALRGRAGRAEGPSDDKDG